LRGDGGDGVASSITGSSVTRAGGGGAGNANQSGNGGIGGDGGGGNGGKTASGTGMTAGTVNTGSGGGGFGTTNGNGGDGGSGIVIFALPVQATATFSAGVTQTSAVVGVNRVYSVTATSTTDETVTIS